MKAFRAIAASGFFALVTTAAAADLAAFESGGKVYPINGPESVPLYLYKRREEREGERRRVIASFSDNSGKEAISEELVMEGPRVLRYSVEQRQAGETSVVETRDGRVFFTHEKDGKKRAADEALTDEFVVGATIAYYLADRWPKILAGETVHSRLAVLDRLETIGFKFRKEGEETRAGVAYVRVKMSPTNILIAAIVEPIRLLIRKSDARIVESQGMTLLRAPGEGKTGNLSAHIVFD